VQYLYSCSIPLHLLHPASWLQVNTVLQDLIDVTKEGVKVDPDALYTAFRLDGGQSWQEPASQPHMSHASDVLSGIQS
jgi:hypothetical protein